MTTHLTDTQKQTIRIALATREGWIITDNLKSWNSDGELVELPNYPADLNACHEIEVKLTFTERCAFRNTLRGIMSEGLRETLAFSECVSASAEHRSLALFRALNLGELGE